VPDFPEKDRRLSGSLCESDGVNIPVTYIGPLSVFTKPEPRGQKKYDYLVLLSGVEPQRTRLENILLEKLSESKLKVYIIRGSRQKLSKETQLPVIDFAYDRELSQLIGITGTVICRSGYSTLMDMHALQHFDLLLIPTPGQPEQVYLARYWKEKFHVRVVEQDDVKKYNFEKRRNSG
jgi:predicted glycosyltransferase